MSDGPLPKSTCGVDSSPEAIAYHLKLLGDCHTARFLTQVARERDEARAAWVEMRDAKHELGLSMGRRIDAAERQLAEARAVLKRLVERILLDAEPCLNAWNDADMAALSEARALLSGETT